MNVLNFIIKNWDFILLIAAAVAGVVYTIFKGNKSVIMKMLFGLVTQAEKEYGGGTGALKLAAVIDQIYPKLPAVIKTFITVDRLSGWVEDALNEAKKKWQSNIAISTYIEPKAETTAEEAQKPAQEGGNASAE